MFQQRKPQVTKEWVRHSGGRAPPLLTPPSPPLLQQQKLPDFVRRLEESLYRTASSKVGRAALRAASACLKDASRARPRPSQAEYEDTSTLEMRLQQVARKMVATPNRGGGGSEASGAGGGSQGGGPTGWAGAPRTAASGWLEAASTEAAAGRSAAAEGA